MRGRVTDLYVMQMAVTGDIKVGRSSDPERRLRQLQTGCPHPLKIILTVPDAGHLEKSIHRLMDYRQIRRNGEWFSAEALNELPPDIYGLLNLEERDWWMKT